MRKSLILTFISFAWVAPALAQDVPEGRTAPPNAAQEEDDILSEGVQAVERSVKTNLALRGYTDIQMVPASFLIRAKDRDGNPVMLFLSPDSIAALQDADPDHGTGPDDSSSSEAPSGEPPTAFPGPNDGQ